MFLSKPQAQRKCLPAKFGRRRGVTFVYFGLGLTTFLGISAIVVDLGYLFTRRAEIQKAADAAALAGAGQLALGTTQADASATTYANYYGFTNGVANASVSLTRPQSDRFRVVISKAYPTFFGGIFGRRSTTVSARGTAEYTSYATAYFQNNGSISSLQAAFVNNGPYALGPLPASAQNGVNSYGDYFSALYCNDGVTPNPLYNPAGYDFGINVPSNYTPAQLAVEIFDPDSGNAGSGTQIDEVHSPASPLAGLVPDNRNKTKYSIIYTDPSTRNETEITSVTYDPANANYMNNNMKWAQDLVIDAQDVRWKGVPGTLKLKVLALNGASENGFYIRTGPTHATTMTDAEWLAAYGPATGNNPSSWTAQGRMSFNFFQTGTIRIDLGTVPASAAGTPLQVTSYDLEGGTGVKYVCDTPYTGYPTGGITGTPVRQNGISATDRINLPADYAGGHWYVDYSATRYDSSSWQITYAGNSQGRVRLVE